MRTTTAAATVLAAILLTGCSSSTEKPAPAETVTKTAPAPLSHAEITERCIDAVAERATTDDASEVEFEPTPEPCEPLSESDYLDAYMDGIMQSNEAGRQELERQIDEAAEADAQ